VRRRRRAHTGAAAKNICFLLARSRLGGNGRPVSQAGCAGWRHGGNPAGRNAADALHAGAGEAVYGRENPESCLISQKTAF